MMRCSENSSTFYEEDEHALRRGSAYRFLRRLSFDYLAALLLSSVVR
jgi:hypothetical protein